MARKYWGEFISIANVNYKVEIWDGPTGSGSGGTELRIVNEGFTIERQGQGDTLFENIVKKSKASVFFAIDNNTDASYFETMALEGEGSHAMIIYKNNAVIWIGRVLSDLFQWQRSAVEGNRIYEITSVDTLSLLDNYKIQESWFTSGKITLLHLITSILKVTELDAYWGTVGRSGYFIGDALLTYENSSGTNYRLPRFRINAASLIKNYDPTLVSNLISDDEDNDNLSCLKALEKILGNFAAYIILENGMFFIHQYAAYMNSIIYDTYSTAETLTATNTVITHEHTINNKSRPFLQAFPTHSYQPAIKKIKLTTTKAVSRKSSKSYKEPWNNSLLSISAVNIVQQKSVKFNFYIKFIPNYRDVYVLKYRAWAVLRSTGDKYTWDGTNWVLTPTVLYSGNLKIDLPTKNPNPGGNTYYHQFRLDYEVPDNGFIAGCDFYADMYLLQNVQTPGSTTIIDAEFTGTITVLQEFEDNLTTYSNTVNTKASKVLDLDSYYYDGLGSDSVGAIQVYDGTNWTNADSWVAPGSASGSFSFIFIKQILGFYTKAVKSVKANVQDNGGYNGLKTLFFDSATWVNNGYTYNAMSEIYDGEWLKLYGDYTAVSEGDTEYYNNPSNQSEFRIKQLEEAVDGINGVQTNISKNLSSNLFIDKGNTNPTIDTRYSVSVFYEPSIETSLFELTELGSFLTLTSGTYTASVDTPSMLCNTTEGNITINLPAADTSKGIEFWFKKISNPHDVIINGTIDGLSHHDINNLNGSVIIVSDGSVYWIKSHY